MVSSVEYFGIKGPFNNILSILSLAEMGVGQTIVCLEKSNRRMHAVNI